ncbi:RHS repeat domain-containing protein [Rhizobacter sp. OV335]|uniref:RHS repeat domain-containing protein n=1 Tax=Rhizobacter sp. OV335 TaxID=1500264 RepID=UPI000922C158|nr:RHS repeat-associated core domain-containing protein [Rhizobacter sp. OV335]SHN18949.1 RHS repeat-associated core domain-containing protein [Rhizobacter sp. OV335]
MSTMNKMMVRAGFAAALLGVCGPTLAQTAGQSVTRTVTYKYDAFGTLVQEVVEPDDVRYEQTTTMVPHPSYGVITSRTLTWQDPLTGAVQARTVGSGYDDKFRYVQRRTNAKQQVSLSTYDPATGEVLTQTEQDLPATVWTNDAWGRKLKESRPDGTATTWAYRQCIDSCLNGATSVTVIQQWGGSGQTSQASVPVEEFEDTLGRKVLVRTWGFDGSPVLSEKAYDPLGRILKISRPHFASEPAIWTWYDQRDALGRLTQSRSPSKTGASYDFTNYSYNGLSRTSRNAKDQTRTEVRNVFGKPQAVTDAYGWSTRYVYDSFGNLVRTIDPKGNRIEIGYDRLGHKTSLNDPSLGLWSYVADPLGQIRQQRDAKQQVTGFEYDVLGRVTRRLEPDMDSRWEYDTAAHGIGQLAETYTWVAGAKDFRRVLGYDSSGRLSTTVTSLDWDYASTQTYDVFGRADQATHSRAARGAGSGSAANTFQWHYNAQGFADRLDRNDGDVSAVWRVLAIDAEGRTTQEQLGNGTVTQRRYNAFTGQLNAIQSGVSAGDAAYQNDSYDYDVLGNLEVRRQLMATGGSLLEESFDYDKLNRLYTSTIAGVTKTTTYDELGNLTTKTGVGLYNYPPSGAGSTGPSAVRGVTGMVAGLANPQFSYDANGNLLKGLARAYAWSSYNMPSSIDKLNGDTATQRTEFVYGTEHERARQVVRPVNAGTAGDPTTTIWYGGSIEKEIDSAANTTTVRTTLPLGLGFIEEQFSGTSVSAGSIASRNPRYFLTDHLGSTLAIADQAGSVAQRFSYDAWGRRRNPDGTDDSGPLWGSLKNDLGHSGYTGHEHLDQLELIHMNARLYDPLLGRHVSADPTIPAATNAQAFNRYSYVLNNALAFVDPTGLGPACTGVGTFYCDVVWYNPPAEKDSQANVGTDNQEQHEASPQPAPESSAPPPESTLYNTESSGSQGEESGPPDIEDCKTMGCTNPKLVKAASDVAATANQIAEKTPDVAKVAAKEVAIFYVGGVAIKAIGIAGRWYRLAPDGKIVAEVAEEVVATSGLAAKKAGRLGNDATRSHIDQVATEMEKRGWKITGGGGRAPEEYLPGPGGARRGSSYPDITATKDGKTLRVNTVDTRADGVTLTTREAANADRIRAQTGEHVLTIPKPK